MEEKKPLFRLEVVENAADMMLCSLYFVLCSIPLVTIGAAATAMHYALRRSHDCSGSPTKDFFSSFRHNFVQATVIWLVIAAIAAVLVGNFWLAQAWESELVPFVKAAIAVMGVLLLAETALVFPMLARFRNSIGQLMKNSLLLALLHPLKTLILIFFMVLPVGLSLVLPEKFSVIVTLWTLGLSGASAYLAQMLIIPIFDSLEKTGENQEGE